MALSLSSLASTKTTHPPIVVIYGVDGVGKTSIAAEFPDPIYIPTEGETPPDDVDMPTPGTIETLDDLLNVFAELLTEDHDRKTVIIDSLDGLESIMWKATSARLGVSSIEELGFGKGYVEADTEWLEFLSAVAALKRAGLAVVMIAHPEDRRFDCPIHGPYQRYGIKLHKRANALVREKCDILAFINYRVTLKKDEVGPKKKVTHAEGAKERKIHLAEGAGFVAKSRYSTMPEAITYVKGKGYSELAKYCPEPTGIQSA